MGASIWFLEWCCLMKPACLQVAGILFTGCQTYPTWIPLHFSFPSGVYLSCFINPAGALIASCCAEVGKKTCWWNQIPWDVQTAHDMLHQVWQSVVLQNLKQSPITSKRLSTQTSSYAGSQWCLVANDDSSTASCSICAVMWHVMSPPSFWYKLTTP